MDKRGKFMNYTQAFNLLTQLQEVQGTDSTFPVNVGFKIIQNRNTLQDALKSFDEMRNGIIKKYADKYGNVSPSNEHYNDCVKELNEIGIQECEVELKKFKLSDLGDISLPMKTLSALTPMIEE